MDNTLLNKFLRCRSQTEAICAPLEIEDYVVQASEDISPPKWHLAHTSWFFETFILCRFVPDYQVFNSSFVELFNSYYKTQGNHWAQSARGQLSRPTVKEVYEYRAHITKAIKDLSKTKLSSDEKASFEKLVLLGIHHEQQHQELLYMDIKYNFAAGPLKPIYSNDILELQTDDTDAKQSTNFVNIEKGLYQIGTDYDPEAFVFDNETPSHSFYLNAFQIADQRVTNAGFLEFLNSDGYTDPTYWKSDAWDLVSQQKITKPLYWFNNDGIWFEYSLNGLQELRPKASVRHISFYEADAFARWSDARLPTEQEWEVAAMQFSPKKLSGHFCDNKDNASLSSSFHGSLWEWTSSSYQAYPGYQQAPGAFGEYNGKFMNNQKILRGGSALTPSEHYRTTYRNFFRPEKNWAFTGIRLAKNV